MTTTLTEEQNKQLNDLLTEIYCKCPACGTVLQEDNKDFLSRKFINNHLKEAHNLKIKDFYFDDDNVINIDYEIIGKDK